MGKIQPKVAINNLELKAKQQALSDIIDLLGCSLIESNEELFDIEELIEGCNVLLKEYIKQNNRHQKIINN